MALLVTGGILLVYAVALLVPAVAFFFAKKEKATTEKSFITILVPARNEEASLKDCLESLSRQRYPATHFEVIVIDDHSTDKTLQLARGFVKDRTNFRVLTNDDGSQGKKAALSAGIQQAKGTIIATTDADCVIPATWLETIAAAFANENIQLVCGPVKYKRSRKFLRHFLQIEQLSMQLLAGGAAKLGFPMLCSGANLAYRKTFFLRHGGYANDPYVSGDDMLLLEKAKKENPRSIVFLTEPAAIVETNAAASLAEALRQRARWLSKSGAYGGSAAGMYGLIVLLANALVPLGFVFSLCCNDGFFLFGAALFGKAAVDLLLLSLAVLFFREPLLLLLVLPGELIYPLLAVASSLKAFSGTIFWKDRLWKK